MGMKWCACICPADTSAVAVAVSCAFAAVAVSWAFAFGAVGAFEGAGRGGEPPEGGGIVGAKGLPSSPFTSASNVPPMEGHVLTQVPVEAR